MQQSWQPAFSPRVPQGGRIAPTHESQPLISTRVLWPVTHVSAHPYTDNKTLQRYHMGIYPLLCNFKKWSHVNVPTSVLYKHLPERENTLYLSVLPPSVYVCVCVCACVLETIPHVHICTRGSQRSLVSLGTAYLITSLGGNLLPDGNTPSMSGWGAPEVHPCLHLPGAWITSVQGHTGRFCYLGSRDHTRCKADTLPTELTSQPYKTIFCWFPDYGKQLEWALPPVYTKKLKVKDNSNLLTATQLEDIISELRSILLQKSCTTCSHDTS